MNKKYDWIIGECNSGYDGVTFARFYGTEQEIKRVLIGMILKDRAHEENFLGEDLDSGTENEDDLRCLLDIKGEHILELYGYNNYDYSHTEFTARRLDTI